MNEYVIYFDIIPLLLYVFIHLIDAWVSHFTFNLRFTYFTVCTNIPFSLPLFLLSSTFLSSSSFSSFSFSLSFFLLFSFFSFLSFLFFSSSLLFLPFFPLFLFLFFLMKVLFPQSWLSFPRSGAPRSRINSWPASHLQHLDHFVYLRAWLHNIMYHISTNKHPTDLFYPKTFSSSLLPQNNNK